MPSEQKLYCVTRSAGIFGYDISFGADKIGVIADHYQGHFQCTYGDNETVNADCLATATAFIINEHITDPKRRT